MTQRSGARTAAVLLAPLLLGAAAAAHSQAPAAAEARPDPLAQRALEERAQELQRLRAEVAQLKTQLAARAALDPPPNGATAAQLLCPGWRATLAASVLALLAGFVLGWRLLDRRIRRKYGGLRIY